MSSMQTRLNKLQDSIRTHPWKTGALLCALLALWFGFNGFDIYGQNKTERDVLAARDKVVKAITPFSKSRIAQMLDAQKQVGPLAFSSEHENIGLIFKNTVEDAELVEVHPLDLAAAYAIAAGV